MECDSFVIMKAGQLNTPAGIYARMPASSALSALDYLQFTELSQVCAEIRRWSFPCVIAPLRLPTGTGSPVNPIAIL